MRILVVGSAFCIEQVDLAKTHVSECADQFAMVQGAKCRFKLFFCSVLSLAQTHFQGEVEVDEEEGEEEVDGRLVDGEEAPGEVHPHRMGAHQADLQVAQALATQDSL